MPKETFIALKKTRVCQHRLDISVAGEPRKEEKRKPLSFKSKKKNRAKAGAKSRGKPGSRSGAETKPGKTRVKKKTTAKS